MTLHDLVAALDTGKVCVTVKDDESEIIVFEASGIDSLSDTVLARTVREWKLEGFTAIIVILE